VLSRVKQTWGVFDLDTKKWRDHLGYNHAYGQRPEISGWTGFAEWPYHFYFNPYLNYIDWRETQRTDWDSNTVGKMHQIAGGLGQSRFFSAGGWSVILREKRSFFHCSPGTGLVGRVRYGDAIDAKAFERDWSAYFDTITLVSADGSHVELRNSDDDGTGRPYHGAGATYDAEEDSLYVQSNAKAGARPLVRVRGLSGNTWDTERLAVESDFQTPNGVRGRMQFVKFGPAAFLVILTSGKEPPQVLRLR
jgi:hypothetical protein